MKMNLPDKAIPQTDKKHIKTKKNKEKREQTGIYRHKGREVSPSKVIHYFPMVMCVQTERHSQRYPCFPYRPPHGKNWRN